MNSYLHSLIDKTRTAALCRRIGRVRRIGGLAIESSGPDASLGELCQLEPGEHRDAVLAEVVAVGHDSVTLMPFGSIQGLAAGCTVEAMGMQASIPVGDQLLGRVIDAFGNPLDQLGALPPCPRQPVRAAPINPLLRPRVAEVLETGVRAIDTLLTLGRGQRVGLFAGSGVGKSTLLGMIARHVSADVNVIALIGERGREVREFIDKQLGEAGLARSVVIAAPADQPALARLQAAHAALAIAEHFRDQGKNVLLTMDSVTRYAMARREVGLSAGEPPTARGYTPSVFADLPRLCERCGTSESGGSITALMTVLVEGDDANEPIADTLRAILDGHVMLSRQLANRAHFPAIDVLQSTSRVMSDIASASARQLAQRTCTLLSTLERNRQLVEIGAYTPGSNRELDEALRIEARLLGFLRQEAAGAPRESALVELASIVGAGA